MQVYNANLAIQLAICTLSSLWWDYDCGLHFYLIIPQYAYVVCRILYQHRKIWWRIYVWRIRRNPV